MGQDTASLLLGLEGLIVKQVEVTPEETRIVDVVTAPGITPTCPECATVSDSVKQHLVTVVRDLPCGGASVRLRWHKRRWRCRTRGCPRTSFTETLPVVGAGQRLTSRLRHAAGMAVVDGGRTILQAGRDHGLSWPTVAAAFTACATRVLPVHPPVVAGLGIDEIRRGRPRFAFDPATGTYTQVRPRWHTGFVDLTGRHGLSGQVEGRSAAEVGAWLAARPATWRTQVRHVAIDLCAAFRAAVTTWLPQAVLVVDHFHLVQLATTMVAEVRRRVTRTVRGRRGRATDPEYGIRRRLVRNHEELTAESFTSMWTRLEALGPAADQIKYAYIAKEELRGLLALARTSPTRAEIARRLGSFYQWCADSEVLEVHRLARTIETWWPQIEAFLVTGVTNATSEGINRVIKLEARNAYGFRNPTNQRLRSLCATTRQTRRQPLPSQT